MRLGKTLLICLAFLGLILVTGCWDRKEIEDVGIVLGIGMDEAERSSPDRDKKGAQAARGQHPQISMIHQLAVPKQFAAKDSGTSQKNYINLISEGSPVFKNIRELSTRSDRTPAYEHLRIIVIGDRLARDIELTQMTNFFLRNMELRRSIRVVIAQGKAKDVFDKSGIVRNPSLALRAIVENYQSSLIMPREMRLGEVSQKLTGKTSFIIPRVETGYAESRIAGAAVIDGRSSKMIGWLNEEEVAGLNLIKGNKKQSGIITGTDPKSGEPVVFEIRTLKSSMKPKFNGGTLSFEVKIETAGKLREDWVDSGNSFQSQFIKRAEGAIAASIRETAGKTLSRIQKELKVDVAGFGTKLGIDNPRKWREWKENWDERFSGVPVEVQVRVQIEEFGTKGAKTG